MDDTVKTIDVEVVFAVHDKQIIKSLSVAAGTTAIEAVGLSAIREDFPEIPGDDEIELGIFSKKCPADEVLHSGDRVEIYRPLLIDPKEARRLKAEVAEKKKLASQAEGKETGKSV